MSDKIVPFEFEHRQVRVIDKAGDLWFVLRDVCEVLGIDNPRNVAARLDDDEKGVCLVDTLGGQQRVTAINESGFYSVVLRSDKPASKPFRRWVTSVVLPTIRKTGRYEAPISDKIRRETEDWYRAKVVGDRALSVMYGKAAGYDQLLNAQGAISVRDDPKLYADAVRIYGTNIPGLGRPA
jgi:prophage antirepressor-like protein